LGPFAGGTVPNAKQNESRILVEPPLLRRAGSAVRNSKKKDLKTYPRENRAARMTFYRLPPGMNHVRPRIPTPLEIRGGVQRGSLGGTRRRARNGRWGSNEVTPELYQRKRKMRSISGVKEFWHWRTLVLKPKKRVNMATVK